MTPFDYHAYLASREWALKREAVKERCQGWCERCWLHPMAATHHLTYKNIGNEPLEDLLGVCTGCHEFLHGKSNTDPALPITNPKTMWEFLFPTPEQRRAELLKRRSDVS